jgi:hypothetical protein
MCHRLFLDPSTADSLSWRIDVCTAAFSVDIKA